MKNYENIVIVNVIRKVKGTFMTLPKTTEIDC